MLARLTGIIESVDPGPPPTGGTAIVAPESPYAASHTNASPGTPGIPGTPGPLAYEVMLPAASAEALTGKVGQRVTLRTFQYFEQQAQGASFVPRLVGFLTESDQRLFELLTKVKGLGVKRALRAMAAPTGDIAAAIANADVNALKALPEIGKKLAETMILELKDKVGSLAFEAGRAGTPSGNRSPGLAPAGAAGLDLPAAQQAVAALVRLGEDRTDAEARVRAVLKEAGEGAPRLSADEILAESFAVG
ncbi:MAG: Holliday junction branch migration protein RuvA [Phycisphaerales bacterium]